MEKEKKQKAIVLKVQNVKTTIKIDAVGGKQNGKNGTQ